MSRLLQTIYSRVFKPYKFVILFVSILIIFLLVSIYVYKAFYAKTTNRQFSDVTNTSPDGLVITIYFFNVDWCPHCTKSLPEWNNFSSAYHNKTVNGYKIMCINQNSTKDDEPQIKGMLQRYNIESYPTVKAIKPDTNGKEMVIDYDARVTNANLEKFVQSITNG